MKKIITLFTFIILFTSCSEENNPSPDSIIGLWKINKVIIEGEESSLSGCFQFETIEIFQNRTLVRKIYKEDSSNNCSINSEIISGIWKKDSSELYRIISFENYFAAINENSLRIWETNENSEISYKEYLQ